MRSARGFGILSSMSELLFEGPAGVLEGRLELPETPDGRVEAVAIVCHPHPLYGGSMRNTICVRASRALRSCGFATLRFNFRGVEGSAGEHDGNGAEEGDARAALDVLLERFGDVPAWVVGYSFGARTVSALAASDPRIEGAILIALPVKTYGAERIDELRQPSLLLFGELDEFGTEDDLPSLGSHMEVHTVAGADHFFRGRTPLVEEHIRDYARKRLHGTDKMSRDTFPEDHLPAIRRVMMPRDTNAFGTIFGGVILAEIDLAAAVEAHTQHRGKVVTVAMDGVVFLAPVYVGDCVSFFTETMRIGTSSIRVKVRVWAQRRFSKGDDVFVTEAEVTMVAVDDDGKKVPVRRA